MPISVDSFDLLTTHLLQTLQPKTSLDIGCGEGKYGRAIKSLVAGARVDGIEIEASYAAKFGLNSIYDRLFIGDATGIMSASEDVYDLAILGDCIEHMPKSTGIDLLNVLIHQCAYILVVAPYALRQDAVDGVGTERHRSVWTERDFHFHDYWAWTHIAYMQWFLLRGYPAFPVALEAVVRSVNETKVTIRSPYRDADHVKPANLQIRDNRLTETINGVRWAFRHD